MAKQRRLGPQIVGWLIFLAILATPVAYLLTREEVIDVTAATIARGHVEQTVTAISSGTVKPFLDSMVATGSLGTVVNVPFEEGDHVNKGDVIVELRHDELDAQVALAEANLKVGMSRLEQAKLAAGINAEVAVTRVAQTAAQLEQAEKDFESMKALADRNAIRQNDFDKAALALKVARESAAAAKAGQREDLVRAEEVRMAEANIEQLKAAVAVATAARENAFVKAPFAGVIARIITDVGEAVSMGMPLLQMVDPSTCYVEAPFDEANAAEIQLEQKARINLDSYRGEDFFGTVEFISPVVSTNPDLSRTLNVRIKVGEETEKFLAGMSADVVLVIEEKEDVVYAPTESLIRQEYAYVIENGRAVRRDIKTGIGNWNTMEILEGLKEGDQLVTSIGLADLADGVRVRVVDALEE
ncbi:MAG: efflux RND transporter periplasmic adaptor subunit [Candidatus Hydrogenedentes bacterium]|nr:efflux RND transporter periplasmic adaptor subunit [Candidatus Hydrogenedentota bacterium]